MKENIENTTERKTASFFSKPAWRWFSFFVLMGAFALIFLWLLFSAVPWFKGMAPVYNIGQDTTTVAAGNLSGEKELQADISRLQKKIERLTPGGVYLVVNTSDNTFFLYKNRELIREGLCSTGSYIKLEADNQKNWVFETPKGVFSIKGKITDPVWHKPDWAFVEEGLPIPPAGDPSRYEYGVLGDYAMALGDGYMIHGTLYKRFIGQAVTHGCIRMHDEDLEAVYKTLPIGAKVFIY